MKKILLLALLIATISCVKETTPDLIVKGTIKGLKKGTIYLKKEQDTAIVTVDSVIINGIPDFELHSNIESPEIFYLYLEDRKSTRLNSSHVKISYAVFCLKKKNVMNRPTP